MNLMHTSTLRVAFALFSPSLVLISGCGGGADSPTSTQTPGATAPGVSSAAGNGIATTGTAGATGAKPPVAGAGVVATGAPPSAAGNTQKPPTAGSPAVMTMAPPAGAAAGSGASAAGGAATPPKSGAAGAAGGGTTMAAGPGAMSSGGLPATPEGGKAPKIPAVMGECPEIKDGTTIMIGGHRNVMITAGEAGKKGALFFYWHGTGSSAEAEVGRLPMEILSDIKATGSIIAGFNGSGSAGGKGDCSGTAAHNIADFDAADALVACAVEKHGIDPRRIYSGGCSAGGLQTGCMAMLRSSYLAAVAPNSGGIVGMQPWQDDHSPAVMTMHGGASDMVIVTFSQTSASFDMAAKTHGSFVINCDHGGGHCQAPNELKIAYWQFMKDHPFGIEKSPWEAGFPAGVPEYCKIY